jgi:hypothetical protein
MVVFRWLVPGCLLTLLVGCGGHEQQAAPAVAATQAPPQVVALPPLTRVPPPQQLFAVARLTNAEKTADTGVAWSGLPLGWRALLEKAVPGLSRAAVLSAPVDFAAMLDPGAVVEPRVEWAFSVGASSTELAVSFLREQGARISGDAASGYHARIGTDLTCVVVRALGAAPVRVVCSGEASNAEALAPYMSCGMPTESFGPSELHAHVTAEPFRKRYGSQVTLIRTVGVPFLLRELGVDHPKFDRALRDVLYGLADEVIALSFDLDRIDMDATVAPTENALYFATKLALSGQRSWWGQTVAHAAGRSTPAPDVFWKLPADVTAAGYTAYSEPERFRGIAAALRELADGWLDYQKLSERRRTPLVEALEQFMTTAAASANATLPVEGTPAAPARGKASAESVRAALGEHLFAVDRGGDSFVRLASELVKSLGDKALRDHLVQTKLATATQIPTGRERAPKFGKGLPTGTKVFELVIPGAAFLSASAAKELGTKGKGAAGEPLSVFLVAMPDAPQTWFAFGTDEKALEARLAQVKAGAGPTLVQREGLTSLKTQPAVSAGFSSLAALLSGMRESLGVKAVQSLELLPHRGVSPMLWKVTSDANGPTVTGTARIPREIVEDVVAMAASTAAGAVKK